MSTSYWFERMKVTSTSGEKKVKDYERTLKRAYEESKRAISKEVASFYQEYATEEGISLPAAYKRLKVDELISFNERSKEYLNEVKAIEDRAEPLQTYESKLKKLSGRAYMTRMDTLKANIEHQLILLNNKEDTELGQTLDFVYDDAYYRNIYDLHKFTKTGVDFAQPGQSQLKAASRYQWNGDNYSSRIWKHKDKLIQTLDQLIPQSFVRGFGSKELAREIADKLEVSYSSAVRLARTEGRYVANLGTIAAYKESGVVTKFQFMATLDDKTSVICQDMDGKVFDLQHAVPGVMTPPLHPYCRSTTVPYFPDDDIDALIDDRVSRNAKGKTYPIGEYQTYKEWAQAKADPNYVKAIRATPPTPETVVPNRVVTPPPVVPVSTLSKEERIKRDLKAYDAMLLNPKVPDIASKEKDLKKIRTSTIFLSLEQLKPKMSVLVKRLLGQNVINLAIIPNEKAYYQWGTIYTRYIKPNKEIPLEYTISSEARVSRSELSVWLHEMGHGIHHGMAQREFKGYYPLDFNKRLINIEREIYESIAKDYDILLTTGKRKAQENGSSLRSEMMRLIGNDNRVSDIMSGISYGTHYTTGYHEEKYWDRDRKALLAKESIAHYTSIIGLRDAHPDNEATYQDIFKRIPNTLQSCEKFYMLCEEVINGDESNN